MVARRQADTAERTLNDFEQPYLFCQVISCTAHEWRTKNERLTFVFKVTNFGKAPAVIRNVDGGVYIAPSVIGAISPVQNDTRVEQIPAPGFFDTSETSSISIGLIKQNSLLGAVRADQSKLISSILDLDI